MDRKRRVIQGVVVADKMAKTRVIEIKRSNTHRLYHKSMVRTVRLFVHDEKNVSKVGDVIEAVSTRPMSRKKFFRVQKIVEKRVGA